MGASFRMEICALHDAVRTSRRATTMELTRVERMILRNQFRILAKLEPNESDYYEQAQTVLEEGYEAHYEGLFQDVDEDTLSEQQCGEVTAILNMFREIKIGLSKLEDTSGINMYRAAFDGFDFNDSHELRLGKYAEFFCEKLDRFDEIRPSSYNSHALRLTDYRHMMMRMPTLKGGEVMTKEQIIQVVGSP